MLRTLALTLVSLFTLAACEETVDITDATYRERLVVYSVLDADDTIDVKLTRTLPINQPYSEAGAAIADAQVTISIVSATGSVDRTVTLPHVGGGNYSMPELVALSGTRYRLDVRWRDKHVTGNTFVPEAPVIDTVQAVPTQVYFFEGMGDTAFTVRAVIRPLPNVAYIVKTTMVDPRSGEMRVQDSYGGAPLARMRDTTATGHLALTDPWGYFQGNQPIGAAIVSYDDQYYEFQRTYYNDHDRGPFGTGSDNVWWTVDGDGIGLFVGRRTDMRRVQ